MNLIYFVAKFSSQVFQIREEEKKRFLFLVYSTPFQLIRYMVMKKCMTMSGGFVWTTWLVLCAPCDF